MPVANNMSADVVFANNIHHDAYELRTPYLVTPKDNQDLCRAHKILPMQNPMFNRNVALLLMIEILHDPIHTIPPQLLSFWYLLVYKNMQDFYHQPYHP